MNYPKIAVFCGFHGLSHLNRHKSSEKDFVYRLLEIFKNGTLSQASRRRGVGASLTADSPVLDMFHFVEELGRGNIIEEDRKLLEECDFAVVILPYRHVGRSQDEFPTSLYALMEYALACGAKMPGILIADRRIPIKELGFAPLLHRWPGGIDGRTLFSTAVQKGLGKFFEKRLKEFYLGKPFVVGYPTYNVDEFYRDHLIRLLFEWNSIEIYNHSILPLCSSYDPADLGLKGKKAWDKFKGVQKYYGTQPHRGLYFELEEALLTGSRDRLIRFIESMGRQRYDTRLLDQLTENTFTQLRSSFSLVRVASLIPSHVYEILKESDKKKALARNLSIMLQMYRLHCWHKKSVYIPYKLFGFRTHYPYSMPTTIYAERKDEVQKTSGYMKKEEKKYAGIWGFLRSGDSLQPGQRTDAFIIGRNCDCVEVWEKHLDETIIAESAEKSSPLFDPTGGAYFENFRELIGRKMRACLSLEIKRRAWYVVARETGVKGS